MHVINGSQGLVANARISRVMTIAIVSFAFFIGHTAYAGKSGKEVILEDFSDIVTANDFGFNDFSGNVGAINKDGIEYGMAQLDCDQGIACALRFDWDFTVGSDEDAFSGLFFALFGLVDTQATFDGETVEDVSFPEHTLNLDNIDSPLVEPGGPRSFKDVGIALTYEGNEPLILRLELTDVDGGGRFIRFALKGSSKQRSLKWSFRKKFGAIDGDDLDLSRAKVFSVIVERHHEGDQVTNPDAGSLRIHRIWFTPGTKEKQPKNDDELLDLQERRACQYFLDWSSRKPMSLGIPQDRSTFGDLLTVGGVGFALPAYIIAAERDWISRDDAIARVLSALRILADEDLFGPEPIGRVGHRGWFYHFLGVDGRRKLNFDFPDSAKNEALNTVELSSIDTALALMGVLSAQSYFDEDTPDEVEIRALAQTIFDRVEWPFMLEPDSMQFYLSWKPNEAREGEPYEIPDTNGDGQYSGTANDPATLDFYTDEAFLLTLLAAGSTNHTVSSSVHCAWERMQDGDGLVRSFPGALFTYFFLHSFLDARTLNLPACPGEDAIDWFENSRKAFLGAIAHAESNPSGFATYGGNAWGISAAEGPDDQYRAYGAPDIAVNPAPDEDGTITYYGMMSAASFGDDLRARVIEALRAAWQRNHWHYRFGLPDAFHDEISGTTLTIEEGTDNSLLRNSGPWVQRALFAIDQGPMLLHLENARTGLIWNLLATNPNIQRALNRLRAPPQVLLEAEDGDGDGQIMPRSNASGQNTIWLHDGESLTIPFEFDGENRYAVSVRYSNDNFGPLETVNVSLDGVLVGEFEAEDTGDSGAGWNTFLTTDSLGAVDLSSGNHNLTITVTGGDGFGVEIDQVQLERE